MATFIHQRFPALTLMDEHGVYAKFREFRRADDGGNVVGRFGVFEADEPELVERLRAACLRDVDMSEPRPTDLAAMLSGAFEFDRHAR